jgi:signal transduction histidine kinase
MKTTRLWQIAALLIVMIAIVQVGWWVFDQYKYTQEKVALEQTLYNQQVIAARALLRTGASTSEVQQLFPDIVLDSSSGEVSIAPQVVASLSNERSARLNQYAWESAFFLVVLGVCIAIIWRTIRAEAKIIQEQDSFLALVSHQFKTPLASLQLSLETMALRDLPPERSRTLIERMLADLARMVTMVSRILDSVRLERGRMTLRPEPLEIATAVSRVTSQLAEQARRDSATLVIDIPAGLEILADPLAVDVVLRNVVENALAAVAAAKGGTITLRAQRLNHVVELTVTDTGIGFEASERSLLFKKFAHLEVSSGSYQGTGLGLYIVQRLMQLSAGRVEAFSAGRGQGATFELSWPAVVNA